jgi:hypothetical protein
MCDNVNAETITNKHRPSIYHSGVLNPDLLVTGRLLDHQRVVPAKQHLIQRPWSKVGLLLLQDLRD